MKIITGKDMAIERERERLQGSRVLTKDELDHNANKIAEWIAAHTPSDVGFVLVLVPRDSDEFGSTASPFDHERTERILTKAAKRVRKEMVKARRLS